MKEYLGIEGAKGPLVFLKAMPFARSGEMVALREASGRVRRAKLIRLEEKVSVAQIYEGSEGLVRGEVFVRYTGEPFRLPLGRSMLGRSFSGVGESIDGGGRFFGEFSRDVNGQPMNPVSREYPRNYINTGISAIDILLTLIRGQKLPIFSGSGLPHRELAAQIVSQAALREQKEPFAVVFGAIGVTHSDARFFMDAFERSGASSHLISYFNYAQDPVSERILTPRCALTAAEYLAFDLHMNVLVVLLDMTSYAEALREVSSYREEVPGRKGYPGYLYSDLATLYERAGIVKNSPGSVTMIPILTMPGDDIAHPVADLSGFITEGQIVLSRSLHSAGVYPPIDVLPSLSRLMKDGIGEGYTREDHADLGNQLFSSYAHVADVRALAQIMGREDLSRVDQSYLDFAESFERLFLSQARDENRSLEESLSLGWEVLRLLPRGELTRLSEERIRQFIHE